MSSGRDRRGVAGTRAPSLADAQRSMALGGAMYVGSAVAASVGPWVPGGPVRSATGYAAVLLVAVTVGVVMLWVSRRPAILLSAFAFSVHATLLLGSVTCTLALYLLGPDRYEIGSIFYAGVAVFAFYLLRLPWPALHLAAIAAGYGLLVMTGDEPAVLSWLLLVISVSMLGAAFGLAWERGDLLAARLADLNSSLEQRVAEQVAETERLSRLRRFLSPQVTEVVLDAGGDALLQPHRRPIAVLFCDLRGFTKFASGAEPEDVVDVLHDYYAVVGALVRRTGATVGTLAGDGVMAYFGDPMPVPDPAGRAMDLAASLREPLAEVMARWQRSGFRLGYGVGVAYGYATLGTIGFDGRHDYTAVGSVVNLAARLCDEAASGEILLDERAYAEVAARVAAEPAVLQLKGFADPVTAYRIPAGAVAVSPMLLEVPTGEERSWPP